MVEPGGRWASGDSEEPPRLLALPSAHADLHGPQAGGLAGGDVPVARLQGP